MFEVKSLEIDDLGSIHARSARFIWVINNCGRVIQYSRTQAMRPQINHSLCMARKKIHLPNYRFYWLYNYSKFMQIIVIKT